jgi:hypothetical protein
MSDFKYCRQMVPFCIGLHLWKARVHTTWTDLESPFPGNALLSDRCALALPLYTVVSHFGSKWRPVVLIFLRRKVPGQTGARTRDLRQHRLALNTNALTLWARSPFIKNNGSLDSGIQAWYPSTRHVANSGELLYTQCFFKHCSSITDQSVSQFIGINSWNAQSRRKAVVI